MAIVTLPTRAVRLPVPALSAIVQMHFPGDFQARKSMMNIHKIKGLTAIELMIVVGVISILLAVGLPGLQDTIARMETNVKKKY